MKTLVPVAFLAMTGFTACTQQAPDNGPNRIVGLTRGSGSFIMTPDGGALSILYDSATLEYAPGGKAAAAKRKAFAADITLLSAAPKLPLRFYVRGFAVTPGPDQAALVFSIGGKAVDISNQIKGEDFTACFDADLDSVSTPIGWRAILTVVEGQSGLMQVDSVDISVRTREEKPLAVGGCEAAPTPARKR